MANTYTALFYHFIFSTKRREPLIAFECEERVWAYLGGITQQNDMQPIRIGGHRDHVHALVRLPTSLSVAQVLQRLKGGSSKWINEQQFVPGHFSWQESYAAFTVSRSNLDAVCDYIARQKEHHRTKSFQDELREFLTKHGIEYDERYLWD